MAAMTEHQERVTRAIAAARAWIASGTLWTLGTDAERVPFVVLTTSRRILSEGHRAAVLAAIDRAIGWYVEYDPSSPDDAHQPDRDLDRLLDLADLVRSARAGAEWLTYEQYRRWHDELSRRGEL